MPQGHPNYRATYPSPTVMRIRLISPLLLEHIETVRRRFAEARWSIDARVNPQDHKAIIVTHDGSLYHTSLEIRAVSLTKRIRENPPDIAEPLTEASFAEVSDDQTAASRREHIMTRGKDNFRLAHASPGLTCFYIIDPDLRRHGEDIRRLLLGLDWLNGAGIDPEHPSVIVLDHDCARIGWDKRDDISKLITRFRRKLPAVAEPVTAASYTDSAIRPLPRPARTTGMEDLFPREQAKTGTGTDGQTVSLQLSSSDQSGFTDLVMSVLQQGHMVELTVGGVTCRIHPK